MRRTLNNIVYILLTLSACHSFALTSDREHAYQVDADSAVYNRLKHIATYNGNVTATQGSTTVHGDTIVIINDSETNTVKELIAYGKPAMYSTLPEQHSSKLIAKANTIKYWPKRGKVLLIDNGHISQSHNEFSGAMIWYDTIAQTVLSGSNQNSRTRIIIEPTANARKATT